MGNYKSLFVVVILGGVMLVLAGTLLQTEQMSRKRQGEQLEKVSKETPPVRLGKAARPRFSSDELRVEALEKDLEVIRALLEQNKGRLVNSDKRVRLIQDHALSVVTAEDWSRIQEEVKRKDPPEGYYGVLLLLAGGTKRDEALPWIEESWKRYPTKAVRALALNSSAKALEVTRHLYRKATSYGARYGIIRAMKQFEPERAREFLLHVVVSEQDPRALKEIVTALRFHPHAESVAALVRCAREVREKGVARRALNSLAGMDSATAHRRLLELALDPASSSELRRNAAESLGFVRDRDMVATVLSRLVGVSDPVALKGMMRFLRRNVSAEDRDALRNVHPDLQGDAAAQVAELLAGLDS